MGRTFLYTKLTNQARGLAHAPTTPNIHEAQLAPDSRQAIHMHRQLCPATLEHRQYVWPTSAFPSTTTRCPTSLARGREGAESGSAPGEMGGKSWTLRCWARRSSEAVDGMTDEDR
ncbi:hypothetical protein ZWY2020_055767 [Hordeum vulgare]|nr:hypothetical protein ZWY2020_055767 [Hordeum vulgare]